MVSDMVEIWVRLMKMPWSVFDWWLAGSVRMVERMRLAAGDGVERMLAPLAAAGGKDLTALGTGASGAATTLKEEKEMSDDKCGVTDCTIRLVQYTIVTIKRGSEDREDRGVLERGERLVTDPMDDCEFDTWVIADYVRRHPAIPRGEEKYLRVASEVLDTWQKQPLHFEEKQLGLLERIAQGVNPL